jgi:hypothetical protein
VEGVWAEAQRVISRKAKTRQWRESMRKQLEYRNISRKGAKCGRKDRKEQFTFFAAFASALCVFA